MKVLNKAKATQCTTELYNWASRKRVAMQISFCLKSDSIINFKNIFLSRHLWNGYGTQDKFVDDICLKLLFIVVVNRNVNNILAKQTFAMKQTIHQFK